MTYAKGRLTSRGLALALLVSCVCAGQTGNPGTDAWIRGYEQARREKIEQQKIEVERERNEIMRRLADEQIRQAKEAHAKEAQPTNGQSPQGVGVDCREWQTMDRVSKLWYITGLADGLGAAMEQAIPGPGVTYQKDRDLPRATQFISRWLVSGYRASDYQRGLDQFCAVAPNVNLWAADALEIVALQFSGASQDVIDARTADKRQFTKKVEEQKK